jgi:Ca2+-binding EF-hand superfamily protein
MDNAIAQIRKLIEDDLALMDYADEKFVQTDRDENGLVDIDELKLAMVDISEELGYSEPSDDIVMQTIIKFDKDRSGQLDKEEFRLFIKSVLQTFLIAFDAEY